MPAKAQQRMELAYQVKDTPKAKLVQAINEEWAEALKNDNALRTALKLRPGEATPQELLRALMRWTAKEVRFWLRRLFWSP